ncbi:MAG TPA: plastocyanin/azurin family copper-binding protein [Nitrososphaera sp.]|nr:plastocyanin/azurin family copper-binding protein [Nitrososphaera sp.]
MGKRVAVMGKPGIIAFPVLLALGAITGYLTYTYFMAAIPQEGFVDSPYRHELTPVEASEDKVVDESKFSKVVTIKILEGAEVQGNPDYDPDSVVASSDALITWINDDDMPHTATSGTGSSDSEAGELFDSGILTQGQKYSVPAADLGAGDHQYYCTVHPYMTSTITVE